MWIGPSPVEAAAAGKEFDATRLDPRLKPIANELDLVQPAITGRSGGNKRGRHGLDKGGHRCLLGALGRMAQLPTASRATSEQAPSSALRSPRPTGSSIRVFGEARIRR